MKSYEIKRLLYALTMILIGIFGLALIGFFFLAMAGMSTPISMTYTTLYLTAALAGPLMLLTGGTLLALNLKARASATIAFTGGIIVTLWAVGIICSAILDAARGSTNPAIDTTIHLKDVLLYGILAAAAGLVDWAGFRALRSPL